MRHTEKQTTNIVLYGYGIGVVETKCYSYFRHFSSQKYYIQTYDVCMFFKHRRRMTSDDNVKEQRS